MAIAAASLLLPWALAFDPQAWVVWGRDVGRLALDTRGGPSWKPLPVVVHDAAVDHRRSGARRCG